VQGHQAPQRDGLAVGRRHVHGGGDHRDVAELHGGGERAGAAADVEAEAEDGLGGLCDLEKLVNGEIQVGLVGIELGKVAGGLEADVGVLLVEAIEGFAGVVVPKDGVVGEGGGEGVLREGSWGNGFGWGLGEAAAAGEGVAAAEDEGFGEVGIRGAEGEGGVGHVLMKEFGMVVA